MNSPITTTLSGGPSSTLPLPLPLPLPPKPRPPPPLPLPVHSGSAPREGGGGGVPWPWVWAAHLDRPSTTRERPRSEGRLPGCKTRTRLSFLTSFLNFVRAFVLAHIKIWSSISLSTADGQQPFEWRTDGLSQLLIALQPSTVNQARTRSNISVNKLDGLHRRHHDHRPGSPQGTERPWPRWARRLRVWTRRVDATVPANNTSGARCRRELPTALLLCDVRSWKDGW